MHRERLVGRRECCPACRPGGRSSLLPTPVELVGSLGFAPCEPLPDVCPLCPDGVAVCAAPTGSAIAHASPAVISIRFISASFSRPLQSGYPSGTDDASYNSMLDRSDAPHRDSAAHHRKHNPLVAAVVGAAGGIAGAWMMVRVNHLIGPTETNSQRHETRHRASPNDTDGTFSDEPATMQAASSLSQAVSGHRLSDPVNASAGRWSTMGSAR